MAAKTKSQAGCNSSQLETSVKSLARIVFVSISPYLVYKAFPCMISSMNLKLGRDQETILNLAPPNNCEWTLWESGHCSASCGEGTRQNTRTKVFNNESPGGKCIGDSKTEEQCNTNICPGKLLSSTILSYDLVLML